MRGFVFEADNAGRLSPTKTLLGPEGGVVTFRPQCVSIDGDVAVIGGHRLTASGQKGRVFVYHRNAGGPGNWGKVKELTPLGDLASLYFGNGIATANGRVLVGSERIIVRSPQNRSFFGSATLYEA